MEYNVRRLKTKDFFKVASIFAKITRTGLNLKTGDMNETTLGFAFLNSALQHAETDVRVWLADLVSQSPQEFDELPFDAPFEIIKILNEQEDLSRFFTRVKGLAKENQLLQ